MAAFPGPSVPHRGPDCHPESDTGKSEIWEPSEHSPRSQTTSQGGPFTTMNRGPGRALERLLWLQSWQRTLGIKSWALDFPGGPQVS